MQQVLLLGLLLGFLASSCGAPRSVDLPDPGPIESTWTEVSPGPGSWNLLLLTLDTTRRDHLGCYGYAGDTSPNLDALAARGIVFEDAISPVPVTLPSHATILTGFDPPLHRVRANGTFVLEPKLVTLAEVLGSEGYATGATVASVPVERRFGLAQGFRSYDDDLPESGVPFDPQQRRAAEITDRTLRWIEARPDPDKPFFHWAHYFDPHFPYDPPEPYRSQFEHPYDGEIAYTDAEIGRLIAGLDQLGLSNRTWIVVVADHGEALGEHGEPYHSMLLYRATQDAPFLLVPPSGWTGLPGTDLEGRRVRELVRLRDIAPTMIHLLGLPEAKSLGDGATLVPLLTGEWSGPGISYMETLVPYLEYGWCELRGVRTADWSYYRAPEPELYALQSDPLEENNLFEKRPAVAARLEEWCDYWSSQESDLAPQALDRETMEQLRSLGYVGSANPVGSPVNDKDPKKLMGVFQTLMQARGSLSARDPESARRLLESALRQDPTNPEALRLLGSTFLELGQPAAAAQAYEALLRRNPNTIQIQLDLAHAYLRAGDLAKGTSLLEEVLRADPEDALAIQLYPRALARSGRRDEARRFLSARAERAPEPAAALVELARFDWEESNHPEARQVAEQALAADPEVEGAHTLLGLWWWEQAMGQAAPDGSNADPAALARAREHLQKALETNPSDPQAGVHMARILQMEGNTMEALELRVSMAKANPGSPFPQLEAGQALQQAGRISEAIPYYETALRLGYTEVGFLAGYGMALAQVGQTAHAREVLQRALAAGPDPSLGQSIRQVLSGLAP